MSKYIAPKPIPSQHERRRAILSRLLFAPLFVWDFFKFGVNQLFGKWLGLLILPAQTRNDLNAVDVNDGFNREDLEHLESEKLEIETHDGVLLDTYEIRPKSLADTEQQHQKYIINFVGNGMSYSDTLPDSVSDARNLNANVVGFDLRGVGASTGQARSIDDLVVDGIAQVQRLLDKGVAAQNITLKAHSLGAGIASLVAKHFHQHEQPINLFSGRSFSNLTNHIVGTIRLKRVYESENSEGLPYGQKETFWGKVLGWIVRPIVKCLLKLTKWEIDAADAFQSIPKNYREYMLVRSEKDKREDCVDDKVIAHYASIHQALKSERLAEKATNAQKPNEQRKELEEKRKEINNSRKMFQSPVNQGAINWDEMNFESLARWAVQNQNVSENAHNLPLQKLQNRQGLGADQFFNKFVETTYEDHGVKPGI